MQMRSHICKFQNLCKFIKKYYIKHIYEWIKYYFSCHRWILKFYFHQNTKVMGLVDKFKDNPFGTGTFWFYCLHLKEVMTLTFKISHFYWFSNLDFSKIIYRKLPEIAGKYRKQPIDHWWSILHGAVRKGF